MHQTEAVIVSCRWYCQ